MSDLVPRETIDALRHQFDLAVQKAGFDCDLYIPTNLDDIEDLDIFQTNNDVEYEHYTCRIFVHWKPSIYRLKKLGVYVEDESPILVKFERSGVNDDGETVELNILKDSYVSVPLEYMPEDFAKRSEFDLVDIIIPHAHDAVIVHGWKAVARRWPNPEIKESN